MSDPGHVFFTQERVGRNKRLFQLHKFRTMKMDTPHDVPTHMLENPEQYIIKAGRVLRKYSLDELEIVRKAELDGEYAKRLKKGGFCAFLFDFIGNLDF